MSNEKHEPQEALTLMRELADELRERIDWNRDVKAADLVRRASAVSDAEPQGEANSFVVTFGGAGKVTCEMVQEAIEGACIGRPAVRRHPQVPQVADRSAEARESLNKAREFVKSRKMAGYDGPCMDALRNIDKALAAMAQQAEQGGQT